MNFLCKKITNWCKENGAISEVDYSIVFYGIQVLLNTLLKILSILLIGGILHHFCTVLISMAVFCSMRYWTGGWHSNTHLGCFSIMLIPCLAPSLLMGFDGEWAGGILSGMMLYSVYRVLRYAPCNSKVNPIEDPKCLQRKKIGGIIEIVGLFIGTLVCSDIEMRWLIILPTFANAVMLRFPVIPGVSLNKLQKLFSDNQ